MDYLGYGAQILNTIIESVTVVKNYVSDLLTSGYKQATANTLVFFDNNPTPYFTSFIDLHHKYSGVIRWKYDMYNKVFYQYNCVLKDTKKYPIMTAYLEINKKDIMYLDDFINSIRIEASNLGYPTLQQLIEVWSYETGIVLDRNSNINFVYIDNEINEKSLNIYKEDFSFE